MAKTTEILVKDLLKPSRTIARETDIRSALRLFTDEGEDVLSVVDEDGRLIGSVSEGSFIRLIKQEPITAMVNPAWYDSIDEQTGARPVDSIMAKDITTLRGCDDIATALKVMCASGSRLLHVVDSEGRLQGIIRMKAIFDRLLMMQPETIDE